MTQTTQVLSAEEKHVLKRILFVIWAILFTAYLLFIGYSDRPRTYAATEEQVVLEEGDSVEAASDTAISASIRSLRDFEWEDEYKHHGIYTSCGCTIIDDDGRFSMHITDIAEGNVFVDLSSADRMSIVVKRYGLKDIIMWGGVSVFQWIMVIWMEVKLSQARRKKKES